MLTQLFQSERSCNDLIRMTPDSFKLLCEKLHGTGQLRNYIHTSTEEQVTTFLFIIGQKFTNRVISYFMCRSGDTISRYFHNMLWALISLEEELVNQPTGNETSDYIYQNRSFYPYLRYSFGMVITNCWKLKTIIFSNVNIIRAHDCLGVIDGTHVHVKVPRLNAARYRGRKDCRTQMFLPIVHSICTSLAYWPGGKVRHLIQEFLKVH